MKYNEKYYSLAEDIVEIFAQCKEYCREKKCVNCSLFYGKTDCQAKFIAKKLIAKGWDRRYTTIENNYSTIEGCILQSYGDDCK